MHNKNEAGNSNTVPFRWHPVFFWKVEVCWSDDFRLKEVQTQLDKQYDLMRLIVQKMDIVSEADQFDEGEEMESTMQLTTSSKSTTGGLSDSSRGLTRDNSAVDRRRGFPTARITSYLTITKQI